MTESVVDSSLSAILSKFWLFRVTNHFCNLVSYILNDFRYDSKSVTFALLRARLRLCIWIFRVGDSQKGLIRTWWFGIHWDAIDVIALLRSEAYISIPSVCKNPQSKEEAFARKKVIVALLIGPNMTRKGFDIWFWNFKNAIYGAVVTNFLI